MSTAARIDAGECSQLFFTGYPSDVDRFKARIDVYAQAANVAIAACVGFTVDDRVVWSTFYANWQTFMSRSTPLFGAYGEWQLACQYSHDLDAWYDKLGSVSCTPPGPKPPEVPAQLDVGELVKWGTVAAVAVGGVYALSIFAPALRELLPRGRR